MEADIYSGLGAIFLIVLGILAAGGLLYGLARLADFRRSNREVTVDGVERPSEIVQAYGPHECYRDCLKAETPFSEGQHPSCAEVCGLTT